MVDINRWYRCSVENPEKKGKYLLLVGIPNRRAGYTDLGVIEAVWNGKTWNVDERYSLCQWKYKKPGEIDKYPNFEDNLRRNSL